MIGIEWADVNAALVTDQGTLTLSLFPGLVLDPEQCAASKTVRVAKRPLPSGDGDIVHLPKLLTGWTYKLVAQAWLSEGEYACKADSRLMLEALGLHLEAMRYTTGRYRWAPTGYAPGARILDQATWAEWGGVTLKDGLSTVTFSIESPFPYAIDLAQSDTTISGSGVLVNAGNTNFYPVIKILGPATSWSVINDTLSKGIVYDQTRDGALALGGGDYAEIDTYRNTIFLNGDGANMSAGLDPTLSDFFVLAPGSNAIEANGADAEFLYNNAWS